MKRKSIFSEIGKRKGSRESDEYVCPFGTLAFKSSIDFSFNEPEIEETINPSQRVDDSENEEDVSVLECSIVNETSPRKASKKRRMHLQTRLIPCEPESQRIDDPSQSQFFGLSQFISEDVSSPSTASSYRQTPISEWLKKDRVPQSPSTELEIRIFESPSQELQVTTSKRQKKNAKSLAETFKFIKARYDSSVRLFGHDLRSGKYDVESSLDLVIVKVAEHHEKLIKTVAYGLKEGRHRLILFRPIDPYEITEGICMKLFSPWQEVYLRAISENVIIGADFYKVVRKNELSITDEQHQEILEMPLPNYNLIKTSTPLFMDVLPCTLQSTRTISKQIARFLTFLELDILILNGWNYSFQALLLFKDLDGFLSFLEIPSDRIDIISNFSVGKCASFSKVSVAGKVTVSENLSAFSILYSYGSKQSYFYMFRCSTDSACVPEKLLNIPMSRLSDDMVDIDDIYDALASHDRRVSLKCQLKERGEDYILVTDTTDRSLKIQIVFHQIYEILCVPCDVNSFFLLKFLRLIHGRSIWDHFTKCEEILDLDDEI